MLSKSRFALLLFPFFIFWNQPKKHSASSPFSACSPERTFTGYTFIHPPIVNARAAYAPFFLDFEGVYSDFLKKDIQRDENLREWNERFCQKATPAEIAEVVYEADENDLQVLLGAAGSEGEKNPIGSLTGNPFAEILAFNHCTEAVDYLLFCRKCEPHVVPLSDEWAVEERDPEAMNELIELGLATFSATKSHFFRLRYAYQIVRLAHYRRDFQQTIDLFNKLMPQIDRRRPSLIYWWLAGHQAGALFRLKKYAEAAYRYSLIFRNCPSKRAQAYRSFHIPDDKTWEKTLLFCENDAERATLFALRAGSSHATIGDLEQIYELDPTSPVLDLVLVSEVQQLEKIYLTTPVSEKKWGKPATILRRDRAAEHLIQLKKLVEKVWREKKCSTPNLWRIMDGYLELLAGDFYAAEKEFDQAATWLSTKNEADKPLLTQLEIWRLLLQICQINPANPSSEDVAFSLKSYESFAKQPDFEPFLKDWLSNRYAETGQPGKATLEAFGWAGLRINPTLAEIDNLILAASDTASMTRMEDKLFTDSLGNSLLGEFYDMRATFLLAQNHPEAALLALRQVPETRRNRQTFTAFKERIIDCVHCPIQDSLVLTRHDLLEKLVQLEFQAKAEMANAAPIYYRLGLAWLNMTYFGPAWQAMDNFRSGASWENFQKYPSGVFPLAGSAHGNRENLSCEIALGWFRQCLALSRDAELSARAAFMAAKCEQNGWFVSPACRYRWDKKTDRIPVLPAENRRFYELLRQNYSRTDFYRQVVAECKWFRAYVTR